MTLRDPQEPALLLSSFAQVLTEALVRPQLRALLDRHAALGFLHTEKVRGWLEQVLFGAQRGRFPNQYERELANFYVSMSGGLGVAVPTGSTNSIKAGFHRGIRVHLEQLRLGKARTFGVVQ